MITNSSKDYETPDEKLSYSQLKDRIREECKRVLPVKERILLLAKMLEDNLTLKETICAQICADLGDVTSERHIQSCLPDEYKQRRRKKATEESTGQLATMSVNEGKNVPEQKAMTVAVDATTGLEEEVHLEDKARPNVIPDPERVKVLEKRINELEPGEGEDSARKNLSVGPIEDVSESFDKMNREPDIITKAERARGPTNQLEEADNEHSMLKREIDDLKNQVKVLSEKSILELFRELQEKFHDQPGLLDAKTLQKVSIEAGKNLVILVARYNSILQEAAERGQPVPFGTYILTKPEMKLVPVRVLVDFDRRRIWIELWEKRLQRLK